MRPLFFQELRALSRLAYFRHAPSGHLTVRPGYVDAAVDMHTHLALRFLLAGSVDLSAVSETRHYFPERGMPMDIGRFAAESVPASAVRRVRTDVVKSYMTSTGIVRTHTVPNLLAEMDRMGIRTAALLPIDFIRQHNSYGYISAASSNDRLVPFLSVHPYVPDRERRMLALIRAGARGVKLHPAMQMFPPDASQASTIYEIAGAFGLPVLFHCAAGGFVPGWLDRFTSPRAFFRTAQAFPNTTFIWGHGGVAAYREVASLARHLKNVYIETSSLPPFAIRHFIRSVGYERIVFGSDWPFVPLSLPVARVLLATEGNSKARKAIFSGNARRLLRLHD